ncbi:MAG: Undecaprenyl-phosphate glucose phosphotransferase [Frankiales bacterium]|nr:Undecaprenyl-phosphate glucose phosphotransferase [Frankiales bacterium]
MSTMNQARSDADGPASRRGPMRPLRLVSVRANQSKRLSSHVFRIVDLAVVAAVSLLVLAHRSPASLLSTPVREILPPLIGALVLARALRSLRLYRFLRSEGLWAHLSQLSTALGLGLAAALALEWPLDGGRGLTTVWEWSILASAGLGVLHLGWWLRVRAWRAAGWLTPNLVIVGATEYAERVITEAIARRHVNVLGIFDDRLDRVPHSLLGVPVLGDVDALLGHKITPFVDRIVIAVEPAATERVRAIAARLAILPNEVTLFLAQEDSNERSAALDRLVDTPLADLNAGAEFDRRSLAKRLQDLLIGAPMLLLSSPLLVIVALAIKLDTRGPVFFRQGRHGFNNEEIVVWKFRSMLAGPTEGEVGPQVSADDERVTRVGRFLRRTSLDELPQLINVLRGEMSLVGPRPHAIGMKTGEVESARLVAEYAHRHRIKPGMTGWAAINGSRGPLHEPAEVQRRVELDVDYIARQSFQLDLRILALTVPRLLGDRHAVR